MRRFWSGFIVLALLVGLYGPSLAQDGETWTCDGGEQDALIAAQAAYDAGDYARASELAAIAVDLCQNDIRRMGQARDIEMRASARAVPTTTPVPDPCQNKLIMGVEAQGSILNPRDVARFCFDGQRLSVVSIIVTARTDELDTFVMLLEMDRQGNGEVVARGGLADDDNPNASIQFYIETAKTYQIHVGARGAQGGDFSVRVDNISDGYIELADIAAEGDALAQTGDLAGAIDLLREALVVAQRIGHRGAEAYLYYTMAEYELDLGRYPEALADYEAARVIFYELAQTINEAYCYQGMAYSYYEMLRYDEAVTAFEAARVIYKELDAHANEVGVLLGLGQIAVETGDDETALAYYEDGLRLARTLHDTVSMMYILTNLGALQFRQERYMAALTHLDEALALREELDDPYRQAQLLSWRGVVYYNQGRWNAALTDLEQRRAYHHAMGEGDHEGRTLVDIATVYEAQGRYAAALLTNEQALALLRQAGDLDTEGDVLLYIARIYRTQGRVAAATDAYQIALDFARDHHDPHTEGVVLSILGDYQYEQGQYTEARATFEALLAHAQANDLSEKAAVAQHYLAHLRVVIEQDFDGASAFIDGLLDGPPADAPPEQMALGYLDRGAVAALTGRYPEAIEHFEMAATAYQDLDYPIGVAIAHHGLGLVYTQQGQLEEALSALMTSRDILAEQANQPSVGALWHELAVTYELMGNRNAAIDSYRQSLAMDYQTLPDGVPSYGAYPMVVGPNRSSMATRLVQLLVEDDALDPALAVAEQERAFLNSLPYRSDVITFHVSAADQALLTTEADLRLALNEAQVYLTSLHEDTTATEADIQAAEVALTAATDTYEQHRTRMQAEGGFVVRQVAGQISTLARIQKAVPPDTTLVVYSSRQLPHIGIQSIVTAPDPNAVAFLITPTSLQAVVLPTTSVALNGMVQDLHADPLHPSATLTALYDALMAPIVAQVTTPRLMIVPDGTLQYVPFAALQAPDGSYLIDHYAISMVASGTTLVMLNDRAAQPAPTSPALVLAQSNAMTAVADSLGVEPTLNPTEADLRVTVAGAGVLVMDAPMTLDPYAPLYSAFPLGEGGDDDGRLEVRELYELDLSQTKLVILSGCETGSGGDGENFGLLNRAFLGAGAEQVVASLWRVDDEATALLMTTFVEAWGETDNAADALKRRCLPPVKRILTPIIGRPSRSMDSPNSPCRRFGGGK